MRVQSYFFDSIAAQNEILGIRPPKHAFFDVFKLNAKDKKNQLFAAKKFKIATNFYSISLKRLIRGELIYGRTKHDYSKGTMLFVAPKQPLLGSDIEIDVSARVLCFHKNYILGHPLQEKLKKYHFFSYSLNEALRVSVQEEKQIAALFDAIEIENENNTDLFSKELILSQLSTLLMYVDRYYHRQFLMRKNASVSVYDRFASLLAIRLQTSIVASSSTPDVAELAQSMNISARYLSDALKAETGKTTKDWIHKALIDKAKELLVTNKDSVATIAYTLGFQYPQYFSRLFKNKVGMTPSEYRMQHTNL